MNNNIRKRRFKRAMLIIRIILLVFFLQGCSAKNDIASQVNTTYFANAEINPDANQRPSPLVVTIFQLKSANSFNNATFFQLYDDSATVLGSSLLIQQQVELIPNQRSSSTMDLMPETRFIGIIGAFRDLDQAQWRKIIPVKTNKSLNLSILLTKNTIDIH